MRGGADSGAAAVVQVPLTANSSSPHRATGSPARRALLHHDPQRSCRKSRPPLGPGRSGGSCDTGGPGGPAGPGSPGGPARACRSRGTGVVPSLRRTPFGPGGPPGPAAALLALRALAVPDVPAKTPLADPGAQARPAAPDRTDLSLAARACRANGSGWTLRDLRARQGPADPLPWQGSGRRGGGRGDVAWGSWGGGGGGGGGARGGGGQGARPGRRSGPGAEWGDWARGGGGGGEVRVGRGKGGGGAARGRWGVGEVADVVVRRSLGGGYFGS
jgi:hypothetical protein